MRTWYSSELNPHTNVKTNTQLYATMREQI